MVRDDGLFDACVSSCCRDFVQCRQTLKKPSSAKQPLRRPALQRLKREEKGADLLVRRGREGRRRE